MTEREMQELARQERNNYQRAWRARNKDKVKAATEKYWMRRAQMLMEAKKGNDGRKTD